MKLFLTLILALVATAGVGCRVHHPGPPLPHPVWSGNCNHHAGCGHYHHNGVWYHHAGHTHGPGCGHHLKDGIWILVP